MDFTLSFPPANALDTDIKSYVKRAAFTARLGRGTLMILDTDSSGRLTAAVGVYSNAPHKAEPGGRGWT
jgi:hypothetical protein